MQIELVMKGTDYFMLTDLMSPLDFKQIVKGRLVSQKKSKKHGVIFTYEFDEGVKLGKKRGRKAKMEEPSSPDDDDVKKESPDQEDEEYDDPTGTPPEVPRRGPYNADEDDMGDLDDDTEYNDDPDNLPDKDLEPVKHFDTNSKKKGKVKAKKKGKKVRAEEPPSDNPDTVEKQEEQDEDEDNSFDPDVNPGRITSRRQKSLEDFQVKETAEARPRIQASRSRFQVEKRPNLFKDDLSIASGELQSKKAKAKIKPRVAPNRAFKTKYEWKKVRCYSCGRMCTVSCYELNVLASKKGKEWDEEDEDAMRYKCSNCYGGR